MKPDHVIQALTIVASRFRSVLDSNGPTILQNAQSRVKASLQKRGARPGIQPRWGYEISPDEPLEFVETEVHGTRLRADIYCDVQWTVENDLPIKQDLVLRVWALDNRVTIRENLDHEAVSGQLSHRGRVMLRYHFDLANVGQPGPRFHVQAGGNARTDELCWLHEAVAIPRIAHPPMDLILACEMVVANFFPDQAPELLEDPHWLGVLRRSQEVLVREYLNRCVQALQAKESVLMSLQNSLWR